MRRASMFLPALAGLALLAGCTAGEPPAPATPYACEAGVQLQVRFQRREALVTLPDGGVLALAQQVSGSGFWYGDGRYTLRGKGREAQWTVGAAAPIACLAVGT
ncbi:MliC family protein [Pseudorhodoferax sp. Leaf267]|uniref:MliC family protein n=1 Tax=Pseudorhodoferax sp. Leaf267 TaxID=1736316 RepID=UPI0006FC2AFC|nr:MliC family protein [Pseudorhodoferax sp. Leaf267]KQP14262.1 hypothetical protein ASF43_15680 [Pseudorhodoferax sp. Leaf267]